MAAPAEADFPPKTYAMGFMALIVAALLVGSAGIVSIPLDSHEALVVRTTQEMHDRGDWVVPYCNGHPRLKKPPLSYWMTGFVASLQPGRFWVRPWHGRAPSVLAGAVMVGLTVSLGRILFSRFCGLLAGLFMVSSFGFFIHTHSARPEMLYSMLCLMSFASFVVAWQTPDNSYRRVLAGNSMWIGFALATLAKGPHIPILMFVGFLIFLGTKRFGWRRGFRIIQPFSGLVIFLVLVTPWWMLLKHRLELDGNQGLTDSQLAGSLYKIGWLSNLRFSYILATLKLVLPWILLIPMLRKIPWNDRDTMRPVWVLLWPIITTIILLKLGRQQRPHYTLPLLGMIFVLLSAGAVFFLEQFKHRNARPAWWPWFCPLHGVGAAVVLAYLILFGGPRQWIFRVPMGIALVGVCLVVAAAIVWRHPLDKRPGSQLVLAGLLLAILFTAVGYANVGWSHKRWEEAHIASKALGMADAQTPLIAIGIRPVLLAFYANHYAIDCGSPNQIPVILEEASSDCAIAVGTSDRVGEIPTNVAVHIIDESSAFGRNGRREILAKLCLVQKDAQSGIPEFDPAGQKVLADKQP